MSELFQTISYSNLGCVVTFFIVIFTENDTTDDT